MRLRMAASAIMMNATKIFIIDRLGINRFWLRFFRSSSLEIVPEFNEHVLHSMRATDARAVFCSQQELEASMCSHACGAADLRERIMHIDALPELLAIGFERYRCYRIDELPPDVRLLGDRSRITFDTIALCTSQARGATKELIALDGHVTGHDIILHDGPLRILVGQQSRLSFGNGCRIGKNVSIILEQNSSAVFGDGCQLYDHCAIHLRSNAVLRIGSGASLSQTTIDCFREIVIGDNFLTGKDVHVRDGDGHDILGLGAPNCPEKIMIGQNVWLGAGVAVLKGVQLGDNCIAGHNAVLAKSFPPNSLLAGNPAQILKQNVSWSQAYTAYQMLVERNGTRGSAYPE
jgi:acetyltransferase-like isoleucine patch superfamily enzyme